MIFVPSRGRRAALTRFFAENQPTLPGRVLIDDDDNSYEGLTLPKSWSFLSAPRDSTVKILNRAFKAFPNEPFYGCVGDDMVCSPHGWDATLAKAATPASIAWGNDGRWGDKLCAAFFVGGDLVRKLDFLAAPMFGHLFVDKVWCDIAHGANRAQYHPGISMQHFNLHDQTYRERKIDGDAETYQRLCADGLKEMVALACEL